MPISELNTSGIYLIRCLANDKVYVGSAVVIARRWRLHRFNLGKGNHHSRYLQRAWNKYGADAFLWEVLEAVEPARLVEREQCYIDQFQSANPRHGFNSSPTAGSCLGIKHGPHSAEWKAKIAAGHLGKKKGPFSAQHLAKISTALKGRTFSTEHRARLSAAGKGKAKSSEHRTNLAAVNIGKKGYERTAEHRIKMSIARYGKGRKNRRAKNQSTFLFDDQESCQ